jgi:hypothetical protein
MIFILDGCICSLYFFYEWAQDLTYFIDNEELQIGRKGKR